jgi:hypothetical protein
MITQRSHPNLIKYPRLDAPLVEFFGILIGDGNIVRYQVKISLHNIDDAEYLLFVCSLIQNLPYLHTPIQSKEKAIHTKRLISRVP